MKTHFDKYHGIGNDFLVMRVERPEDMNVERAVALCDRHYGVGGDGVLLISPPKSANSRATMSVINSDGSVPEMCGNGLRCVALHLAREKNETAAEFLVDTGAGALLCKLSREGNRGQVATDIGGGTPLGILEYRFGPETFAFERISTGNPHAICFRPQIGNDLLDKLGPAVSASIHGGANVEIATVTSRNAINVAVWERGAGRTLACGTGAAATVIAAVRAGLCPAEEPVAVTLPGGVLEITVTPSLRATLKGPAEWVYSGSL